MFEVKNTSKNVKQKRCVTFFLSKVTFRQINNQNAKKIK